LRAAASITAGAADGVAVATTLGGLTTGAAGAALFGWVYGSSPGEAHRDQTNSSREELHRPYKSAQIQEALANPTKLLVLGRRGLIRERWLMETMVVAEDDPSSRELVCEILEAQGYHVVAACDGRDALDQIEKVSPDLLVMDIQMP
jgi:hypothetical protein